MCNFEIQADSHILKYHTQTWRKRDATLCSNFTEMSRGQILIKGKRHWALHFSVNYGAISYPAPLFLSVWKRPTRSEKRPVPSPESGTWMESLNLIYTLATCASCQWAGSQPHAIGERPRVLKHQLILWTAGISFIYGVVYIYKVNKYYKMHQEIHCWRMWEVGRQIKKKRNKKTELFWSLSVRCRRLLRLHSYWQAYLHYVNEDCISLACVLSSNQMAMWQFS